VQADYKNLMIGGDTQDERLSWFIRDVLFPLAHMLQVTAPVPPNLLKKTMQLQNEIAGCLVDLAMRLTSNLETKNTITNLCCMSLLDNPQRFINTPTSIQQRAFQSILQAMAFVSCEFSEDLGDSLSYNRIKESDLVTKCLMNETMNNLQSLLDENFLISLVHLVFKSWIKMDS